MAEKTYVPAYDSYLDEDFKYGHDSSQNLNPKRETPIEAIDDLGVLGMGGRQKDVLALIEERLQKITDDLVRKAISKKPEEVAYAGGIGGGESLPIGPLPFAKRAAIFSSGGRNNALIFPCIKNGMDVTPMEQELEFLIGTFPGSSAFSSIINNPSLAGNLGLGLSGSGLFSEGFGPDGSNVPFGLDELIDVLDLPPQIECDEVLSLFFGFETSAEDYSDSLDPLDGFRDENGLGNEGMTFDEMVESFGGNEDGLTTDGESYFDRPEAYLAADLYRCAGIELRWLKIILAVVKAVTRLKRIIDLILSIIMPIIEIIRLASMCWKYPVNIKKIIQIIIHTIVAIAVIIVCKTLQLLWDILNLDCITNSVDSTRESIERCLAAFASLANAFNPTAVSMIVKDFNKSVMDPLADVADDLKGNVEGWMDVKNQVKDLFTDQQMISKALEGVEDQFVGGVKSGTGGVSNSLGKLNNVFNKTSNTFSKDGGLKTTIAAFNSYKDSTKLKSQASRTAKSATGMIKSAQFIGLSMTKVDHTEGA